MRPHRRQFAPGVTAGPEAEVRRQALGRRPTHAGRRRARPRQVAAYRGVPFAPCGDAAHLGRVERLAAPAEHTAAPGRRMGPAAQNRRARQAAGRGCMSPTATRSSPRAALARRRRPRPSREPARRRRAPPSRPVRRRSPALRIAQQGHQPIPEPLQHMPAKPGHRRSEAASR